MEVLWIAPRALTLLSTHGQLPASTVELGGVPRGAAVVLCGPQRLAGHADVIMNRLAAQGYESVALEAEYSGPVSGGEERALDSVRSALRHLGRRGWEPEQVGVVGYQGFAAEAALVAATEIQLGAAVSVAPPWMKGSGQFLPDRVVSAAGRLVVPWLGLLAADVPVGDSVRAEDSPAVLGAALSSRAQVFTELVVYPEVDADFLLGPGRTPANEAAAQEAAFDGWQRTVEWLNLRVVPRPTPLAHAWYRTHPVSPRPGLPAAQPGRLRSAAKI